MPRYSYQTALRAKGIKPIRHRTHTDKSGGGIELLPVAGIYDHGKKTLMELVNEVGEPYAQRSHERLIAAICNTPPPVERSALMTFLLRNGKVTA